MKQVSFLAILLFCFMITGCVYGEAPQESFDASAPLDRLIAAPSPVPREAVISAVPDGFIKNEAGATDAEVFAIFQAEKSSYDIEAIAGQGIHLYIYARQEWHDGAVLLAGVSPMGEIPPELYYINGGDVVMRTSDSDIWSINYTHYQGETIVFGKSFAWDNGPLATDEVRAEFWNGEAVTVPMKYIPNGERDITQGYICVTPSITWLKSLQITTNGIVVADDGSGQFLNDPSNQPWYGEAESIRNRTRYVWTSDAYPDGKASVIEFFGGTPAVTFETPYEEEPTATSPLEYWPKSISPDIWHSNNGLHSRMEAMAGSRITAEVIAVSDSFDPSRKVSDLSVTEVYWVDLSIKDDTKCISKGELVCPTEKGFYLLVVETEYGCFFQMLKAA